MKTNLLFIGVFFLNTLNAQQFKLVKDINPNGDSYPSSFALINNKLFFGASDGANIRNPYITDGTTAGTTLLKAISTSPTSNVTEVTNALGKLIFTGRNSATGVEPYITDGTMAGTMLLADVRAGTDNSFPNSYYEFNNKVYFNAISTSNGNEVHVSDGTASGTQMLKDITPGVANSPSGQFIAINNTLFFKGNDGSAIGPELYSTNGTSAGTNLFKVLKANGGSDPTGFKIFKNKVYFNASGDTTGNELFITDGTYGGTDLFIDLDPGTNSSTPRFETISNNKLFFTASVSATGRELYITDGTVAGTTLLKDINANGSSNPNNFITVGNLVFFVANDGLHGEEIWYSDGTTAGTQMVQDFNVGVNSGIISSNALFANNNGSLFARVSNGVSNSFLAQVAVNSIATFAPTSSLLNPLSNSTNIFPFNNKIYLNAAYDSKGNELWEVDLYPTKIESKTEASSLEIFPTRTTSNLTIQFITSFNTAIPINVYDVLGKCVLTKNITSANANLTTYNLDVSNLANGTYIISIAGKGKQFIKE